jgi:hypothetical protein
VPYGGIIGSSKKHNFASKVVRLPPTTLQSYLATSLHIGYSIKKVKNINKDNI